MKKITNWILAVLTVILVIDCIVIGLKLLNGDYDITIGTYIAGECIIVICGCNVYRKFSKICPHCGKTLFTNGKYCSYCGKEIK